MKASTVLCKRTKFSSSHSSASSESPPSRPSLNHLKYYYALRYVFLVASFWLWLELLSIIFFFFSSLHSLKTIRNIWNSVAFKCLTKRYTKAKFLYSFVQHYCRKFLFGRKLINFSFNSLCFYFVLYAHIANEISFASKRNLRLPRLWWEEMGKVIFAMIFQSLAKRFSFIRSYFMTES